MGEQQKPAMIKVRCPNPSCRRILAVKVELAGRKGRCPLCKQAMSIPQLPGADPKQAAARGPTVVLTAPAQPKGEEGAAAPPDSGPPEQKAPAQPVEIPHPSSKAPPGPPAPGPEAAGTPQGAPGDPWASAEPLAFPDRLASDPIALEGDKGKDLLPEWLAQEEKRPPPPPPPRSQTPLPRHTRPPSGTRGPSSRSAMEILTGMVPPKPAPPDAPKPPAGPEERAGTPPAPERKDQRKADAPPTEAGQETPSGRPQKAREPSSDIIPVEPKEEPGEAKRKARQSERPGPGLSREPEPVRYKLSGGVLTISGAVGYDLDPEFARRCKELLLSPETDLVIDLSAVAYLSSTYLGVLAPLFPEAGDAGKNLALRVQPKVARVLHIAGFGRLGKLIVSDAETP